MHQWKSSWRKSWTRNRRKEMKQTRVRNSLDATAAPAASSSPSRQLW
jgi:hypothetical protein